MTLKEIHRTLEKFGMIKIDAEGRAFDPTLHHAMMNVERADMDEKMVAEELRTGYLYNNKVLRPSLVAVSVKPKNSSETDDIAQDGESQANSREADDSENTNHD